MEFRTAELLENMTDAAKFERLATLILRKADHRFAAIMHLGVNARGQPIPAPNDGFCLVPGSDPPQFLWAQHSIEARRKLREKWLSENEGALGDLFKAALEADELRKNFPTGKFIVILSTNQRLPTEKKNKSLANDVYTTAHRKGIEAIIWEQSQYRDFLDTDPYGQWFRKEFFGIESERLSAPLLAYLSHKSLSDYEGRQYTSPSLWIQRQLDERVGLQSEDEPYTVKFIVGESGFGKTAIAYRFLHHHIEADGYGLYIPERIVENAISLEEALRQTLQQLYPSLHPDEIENLPSLIPTGSSFFIIVDDVNQANNPPEIIRKLVSWGRYPYLIVCPVWPRFLNPARSAKIKATVDVISVGRMQYDEAIEAVQSIIAATGRCITALDARKTVSRLRCDPLHIGTLGLLLSNNPNADMLILADNVVETYISQYVGEAANASINKFFEHEYYDALKFLTAIMLQKKNLYPHWSLVEEWLQSKPKQISIIRDLASFGKICQVSGIGEFRFQHDRFLEHFSILAICPMLVNPTDNLEVLGEPYYAELIGHALVKCPQSEAVLNEMIRLHPLALSFSVQEIGIPTTDYHHKIIQKVQNWVKYAGANSRTPETLRAAIANCFINTDSPAILDIVHNNFGLEVPWLGDMARLRNGDLESGVKFFALVGTDYRQDNFVTEIVEHAKRYHGERLRMELLHYLSTSINERMFKGVIVLAGYLGFPGLQEAIVSNWLQQSNRASNLDIAIWAVFRSGGIEWAKSYLDVLFEYWAEMPDIKGEDREEYQLHIAEEVRRLLGNQADENMVQYLIEQAHRRPQLVQAVSHICGRIDLPQAIEFAVRQAALRKDWYLGSSLTNWASFDNPRLSTASISILKELWESVANQDAVRQVAFHLWLENVDRETMEVLPLIQQIPPRSPLYTTALRERALLGDKTCVPALLGQLETQPNLYYVVPAVWDESLKHAVSTRLRSFMENIPADYSGGVLNEHYILAPTLTEIPIADAEELISEHWNHLRYSPLFLLAAIFVGTPKTLALVDGVMGDYPTDIDPFKHLNVIYRFYYTSMEKRLTLNHLRHLEHYVARVSRDEQYHCAAFCYRQGGEFINWSSRYLSREVNDECRSFYTPTEEDILQQLDVNSTHLRNHTIYLLDQFRKKNDPIGFLDILSRWLQNKPTWQKVVAAAHCIELIGSRANVAILDVPLEHEWEKRHIEVVKESVLFGVCRRTLG
jgi:hypothetical protein